MLFERLLQNALALGGYKSRLIPTSRQDRGRLHPERGAPGHIHVLEARGRGTLPPFLLLHGLSSEGVHFAPILGTLRREAKRVIAPDAPGHGRSYRPELPYVRADLEAAYFAALDQVLTEPAIVVGNSMGGLAAVRYANHNPKKVRGLVLISPAGAQSTAAELETWLDIVRVETHGQALEFVDRVFSKKLPIRHLVAMGLKQRFLSPEVRGFIDGVRTEDLLRPEEIRGLHMPTLLLWGGADRLLERKGLDFFRSHLGPHAEVEEPAEYGHSPYLDRPGLVAERLLDFARAVEATHAPLPEAARASAG